MKYPFDSMPDSAQIVEYYRGLHSPRYIPEDEHTLWRSDDDRKYLYIEVDTYVDWDLTSVVMLDVRINDGNDEMRHKLYIQVGWGETRWEKCPITIPFFCEHGCEYGPCVHEGQRMQLMAAEYYWFVSMMHKNMLSDFTPYIPEEG